MISARPCITCDHPLGSNFDLLWKKNPGSGNFSFNCMMNRSFSSGKKNLRKGFLAGVGVGWDWEMFQAWGVKPTGRYVIIFIRSTKICRDANVFKREGELTLEWEGNECIASQADYYCFHYFLQPTSFTNPVQQPLKNHFLYENDVEAIWIVSESLWQKKKGGGDLLEAVKSINMLCIFIPPLRSTTLL